MRSQYKNTIIAALFIALTAVATIIIKFPIPATEGYANLGDSVILVASVMFGPFTGFLAGGFGSALADIFSGYVHYAPFTFVIKGLEGFLAGYLGYKAFAKSSRKFNIKTLAAMAVSVIIMVLGYFIVEIFMYGFSAASLSSLFNLVQAAAGFAVAVSLIAALRKFNL